MAVDRWSALHVLIESVLSGKYPYDVSNHLNQTTSNFPGLFYLGLPFYALGDVGYFQSFIFLLLMYFLNRSNFTKTNKVLFLFLLLISPSYLWEVVVKSDLMSNLFLVLLFIYFWSRKNQNVFVKPYLLSFFCSFLFLTRGVVIIPLLLFLFQPFLKARRIEKVKFILGIGIFSILISLPIILTIPSLDIVLKHNLYHIK